MFSTHKQQGKLAYAELYAAIARLQLVPNISFKASWDVSTLQYIFWAAVAVPMRSPSRETKLSGMCSSQNCVTVYPAIIHSKPFHPFHGHKRHKSTFLKIHCPQDLIKKLGTKKRCVFPPPLTPKMYMKLPEHGQQKCNKRNPSNMPKPEHVPHVNKLYMVPSLRTTAKLWQTAVSHKSMLKPTSRKWTAFNHRGIILTQNQPIWRLVLGKAPNLISGKQSNVPPPKRDDSKDATNDSWVPTFSFHKLQRGGQCAWLRPHSQLMNTDVQQDEAQAGGRRTPSISTTETAVPSTQLVLTRATKNKPWVTGGQLNVFQKTDIIKSIPV